MTISVNYPIIKKSLIWILAKVKVQRLVGWCKTSATLAKDTMETSPVINKRDRHSRYELELRLNTQTK